MVELNAARGGSEDAPPMLWIEALGRERGKCPALRKPRNADRKRY